VPDPKVVIGERLQYNRRITLASIELSLPGHWTILPSYMHAIQ
jgi:hypothetical protein